MPKAEPKCVLELSKEFGLFDKQAFPFLNTEVIDIFHFYKNITMFWIRTMKSWYQKMPGDVLVRRPLMGMVQDWRLSGTEELFIQNISHYWTITLFFLFWSAGWTTSVQHIMYLIIIRITIRVIGISIWRWIIRRILGLTLIISWTPLTSFWWWWIQSALVSSILFMPKYRLPLDISWELLPFVIYFSQNYIWSFLIYTRFNS